MMYSMQNVTTLDGLQGCPDLTQLWVCNTGLTSMSGIEHCPSLEKVALYGNQISRLDARALGKLTSLRHLDVHSNRLGSVDGVTAAKRLNKLVVAVRNVLAMMPLCVHTMRLQE